MFRAATFRRETALCSGHPLDKGETPSVFCAAIFRRETAPRFAIHLTWAKRDVYSVTA